MFHNNIVKISEKIEQVELVENLAPNYLPCRFLHDFASFVLWGKSEKYLIFLKSMTRIKLFCTLVITTNGFALNHDKSLQIYFFFVKRQTKNYFLKDVESTVVWVLTLKYVSGLFIIFHFII